MVKYINKMFEETKINSLNKDFETIRKIDKNGVEFWQARELMPLLGYPNWQKSEEVIARAAQSCINSGQAVDNHFNQLVKMVTIGSNTVVFYLTYVIIISSIPK